MEVGVAAQLVERSTGEQAGLSVVMFIDPLIDRLMTESSGVTGETDALPSDGLQMSFFGLSNQMSDSPLRLCHAKMNVHAGTGAACANKDLNTEKNGPAQPSVRL